MFSAEMLDSMLRDNSQEAQSGIIAFAGYLTKVTINQTNYSLFIKILNRNIPEATEKLFSNRQALSFFCKFKATGDLIQQTLSLLIHHQPHTLLPNTILACLGVLDSQYHSDRSGFQLYQLSVSDLYHIGKYLIHTDKNIQNITLEIIENLRDSSYGTDPELSVIIKKIIDHYYDQTKKIEDVIPANLLI